MSHIVIWGTDDQAKSYIQPFQNPQENHPANQKQTAKSIRNPKVLEIHNRQTRRSIQNHFSSHSTTNKTADHRSIKQTRDKTMLEDMEFDPAEQQRNQTNRQF